MFSTVQCTYYTRIAYVWYLALKISLSTIYQSGSVKFVTLRQISAWMSGIIVAVENPCDLNGETDYKPRHKNRLSSIQYLQAFRGWNQIKSITKKKQIKKATPLANHNERMKRDERKARDNEYMTWTTVKELCLTSICVIWCCSQTPCCPHSLLAENAGRTRFRAGRAHRAPASEAPDVRSARTPVLPLRAPATWAPPAGSSVDMSAAQRMKLPRNTKHMSEVAHTTPAEVCANVSDSLRIAARVVLCCTTGDHSVSSPVCATCSTARSLCTFCK